MTTLTELIMAEGSEFSNFSELLIFHSILMEALYLNRPGAPGRILEVHASGAFDGASSSSPISSRNRHTARTAVATALRTLTGRRMVRKYKITSHLFRRFQKNERVMLEVGNRSFLYLPTVKGVFTLIKEVTNPRNDPFERDAILLSTRLLVLKMIRQHAGERGASGVDLANKLKEMPPEKRGEIEDYLSKEPDDVRTLLAQQLFTAITTKIPRPIVDIIAEFISSNFDLSSDLETRAQELAIEREKCNRLLKALQTAQVEIARSTSSIEIVNLLMSAGAEKEDVNWIPRVAKAAGATTASYGSILGLIVKARLRIGAETGLLQEARNIHEIFQTCTIPDTDI